MKTVTMPHPSQGLRPHEVTSELDPPRDAWLTFIGIIHTPWKYLADCPRQGRLDGPECRIELTPPWDAALDGIETLDRLEVYYWLHLSRRDLLKQNPGHRNKVRGTFALRSPMRPNPIGVSLARLVRRDSAALIVKGLDCLDRTPLIDIKPDRDAVRRVDCEEKVAGSQ